MLAAIEGRLEELFETVEGLPVERVEAAEKVTIIDVTLLYWNLRIGDTLQPAASSFVGVDCKETNIWCIIILGRMPLCSVVGLY